MGLVQSEHQMFSPKYSRKIGQVALSNNRAWQQNSNLAAQQEHGTNKMLVHNEYLTYQYNSNSICTKGAIASLCVIGRKVEDIKGVIKSRISKDRQNTTLD